MSSSGAAISGAPRRRAIVRVLGLALAAAFLYGGWAVIANASHGWPIALRSGAVQGTSSALTTLVISSGIEAIFTALARVRGRAVIAAVLPPTASSCVHAIAHALSGTPEILRTIAPSVALGYVFAAVYVAGLVRASARG